MTLYEATVQYGDGALRIDATVENGSDRDLSLDVVLAEINGLSVLGYGVYSVYAGETVTDYILFDAEGDEEVAAALAAPESLRFTIWAYDNGTRRRRTSPPTLRCNSCPAHHHPGSRRARGDALRRWCRAVTAKS